MDGYYEKMKRDEMIGHEKNMYVLFRGTLGTFPPKMRSRAQKSKAVESIVQHLNYDDESLARLPSSVAHPTPTTSPYSPAPMHP
jgi:hypothetical protein